MKRKKHSMSRHVSDAIARAGRRRPKNRMEAKQEGYKVHSRRDRKPGEM